MYKVKKEEKKGVCSAEFFLRHLPHNLIQNFPVTDYNDAYGNDHHQTP